MKNFILILTCTLGFGLSACSLDQTQLAAEATKTLAPANVVSAMQTKCTQGASLLAVATSSVAPKVVSDKADYLASYCNQLNSGIVPSTTDSNTSSWWDTVLNDTLAVAKVAMFVLPLI